MNEELTFTGEYVVPGKTPLRIERDHRARYHFASQFVEGKRVLDIACGTGYGCQILHEAKAKNVVGVDRSVALIGYAKVNYKVKHFREDIDFVVAGIVDYKSDSKFDVIVCFETIEHVEDDYGALSNLYSLLKNNGTLVISSPNRPVTSPGRGADDQPLNEYHVREYTPPELTMKLQDCGFTVGDELYGQMSYPDSRVREARSPYIRYFILTGTKE